MMILTVLMSSSKLIVNQIVDDYDDGDDGIDGAYYDDADDGEGGDHHYKTLNKIDSCLNW